MPAKASAIAVSSDPIDLLERRSALLQHAYLRDAQMALKRHDLACAARAARLMDLDANHAAPARSGGALPRRAEHHVAVGFADGTIEVYTLEALARVPTPTANTARLPPPPGAPLAASRVVEHATARGEIADLKFCPNSRYLAAAGHRRVIDVLAVLGRAPSHRAEPDHFDALHNRMVHDDTVRLYAPWRRLRAHSAPVLHIDWADDGRHLRSNSSDYEVLYWDVHTGSQIRYGPNTELGWAEWTCVLGFPAMGIWPEGADGTEVNALHMSDKCDSLVTANDGGEVRLFRAPCVVRGAPCAEGLAHSSHVSCTRFLVEANDGGGKTAAGAGASSNAGAGNDGGDGGDDDGAAGGASGAWEGHDGVQRIVSTGAWDACAMQWRLVRGGGGSGGGGAFAGADETLDGSATVAQEAIRQAAAAEGEGAVSTVKCHICGSDNLLGSFGSHLAACAAKWDAVEGGKPEEEREPAPLPPDVRAIAKAILGAVGEDDENGDGEEIDYEALPNAVLVELNAEAQRIYKSIVLTACEHCGRIFAKPQLGRHQKLCTAAQPMARVGTAMRSGALAPALGAPVGLATLREANYTPVDINAPFPRGDGADAAARAATLAARRSVPTAHELRLRAAELEHASASASRERLRVTTEVSTTTAGTASLSSSGFALGVGAGVRAARGGMSGARSRGWSPATEAAEIADGVVGTSGSESTRPAPWRAGYRGLAVEDVAAGAARRKEKRHAASLDAALSEFVTQREVRYLRIE